MEGDDAAGSGSPGSSLPPLDICISDAVSQGNNVIFTVETKTKRPSFPKTNLEVTRKFEEFVWLHERLVENPDYAHILIPPHPAKPDFSESHQKLSKLQNSDDLSQAAADKLKAEIQGDYLAAFQKTVHTHEVFLRRVAAHPELSSDQNVEVFLYYDQSLDAKMKSTGAAVYDFLKKQLDSTVSTLQKHIDRDGFYRERTEFLITYNQIAEFCVKKVHAKNVRRKQLSRALGNASTALQHFAITESDNETLKNTAEHTSKLSLKQQKIEKKLAAKEDLKLTDLLRYYRDDSRAALNLLVRRVKAFFEQNKADVKVQKAMSGGKPGALEAAREALAEAQDHYQKIDQNAKKELENFRKLRVEAWRKGLTEYAKHQVKQSQAQFVLLQGALEEVKAAQVEVKGPRRTKPTYIDEMDQHDSRFAARQGSSDNN